MIMAAGKVEDAKNLEKEQESLDHVDEKKIATAIKFLQNPNVRKTSFDNRVSFLRKKGLTEKEIETAVARSGTKEDENIEYKVEDPRNIQTSNGTTAPSAGSLVHTTSSSFTSQLSSVLIGGGIIYAAAYVVKAYIVPYITGKENEEIESLERNIKELSEGVNDLSSVMKSTLKALEEKLQDQQITLSEVNAELAVTKRRLDLLPSDVTSLSDVKAEIGSVKSLLLSRNQFPATPFAPTSTSPSIPAWQKASTRRRAEDTKTESMETRDIRDQEKTLEAKNENESVLSGANSTIQCLKTAAADEPGKDDSLPPEDSLDGEVAELTENNLNTFSSTYVKVDGDC